MEITLKTFKNLRSLPSAQLHLIGNLWDMDFISVCSVWHKEAYILIGTLGTATIQLKCNNK